MEDVNERYARHYSLKGFGPEGQQKLSDSKVLVIGAGGLGCPALQYLAAAGVGIIGISDTDTVSITNLQRQVLYGTADVGKKKAEVAAQRLAQLNNEIAIVTHECAISNYNALDIISDYDLVLDCTDNFASRYAINDACVLLQKPLIFGAIYLYEGQVAVFNVAGPDGNKTNYRHLFPDPPDPSEVANCNEVGVLGVLPGIIGTLQATEAIKYITGIGEILANRVLTMNLLNYDTIILEIEEQEVKNIPSDRSAFEAMDYQQFCGIANGGVKTLESAIFTLRISEENTVVIDVRELGELPVPGFKHIRVPLSALQQHIPEIMEQNILLFCQSGKRSLKAGQLLSSHFGESKQISHLGGGIIALHEKPYG